MLKVTLQFARQRRSFVKRSSPGGAPILARIMDRINQINAGEPRSYRLQMSSAPPK